MQGQLDGAVMQVCVCVREREGGVRERVECEREGNVHGVECQSSALGVVSHSVQINSTFMNFTTIADQLNSAVNEVVQSKCRHR